jgi:hypothetical protein
MCGATSWLRILKEFNQGMPTIPKTYGMTIPKSGYFRSHPQIRSAAEHPDPGVAKRRWRRNFSGQPGIGGNTGDFGA